MAQLPEPNRATFTPGANLRISGTFVAPERRMSSAVMTVTAAAVRDNGSAVRATDVTLISINSSSVIFLSSFCAVCCPLAVVTCNSNTSATVFRIPNRSQACQKYMLSLMRRFSIVVLAVWLVGSALMAQDAKLEDRVKATFIFNFVQYSEWPRQALPSGSQFNICLVGDSFQSIMEDTVRGESFEGRSITVKPLSTAES